MHQKLTFLFEKVSKFFELLTDWTLCARNIYLSTDNCDSDVSQMIFYDQFHVGNWKFILFLATVNNKERSTSLCRRCCFLDKLSINISHVLCIFKNCCETRDHAEMFVLLSGKFALTFFVYVFEKWNKQEKVLFSYCGVTMSPHSKDMASCNGNNNPCAIFSVFKVQM